MRPLEPATDRIRNRHSDRFNRMFTIPFCSFKSRSIIIKVEYALPTIAVIYTTQVVLFLFRPDVILIIIGRTTSSDTTTDIGIIVQFGTFGFICRNNRHARLTIRGFNRSIRPIRSSITHRIDSVTTFYLRIRHDIQNTFCI